MKPLILFVDDDADILDGFRRMLRPYSDEWRMQFTRSAADAWQFLQEHPVDAIISDVAMPQISGLELLQRVRSCPQTREIPVAILTGLSDSDLKHRVLDLGATDLLNKPLQLADLLARLKSMLRLKAVQDELKRRNDDLEATVRRRTRQLHRSRMQILWRLSKAADFRDEDTGEHVVRVACYSTAIAETLGLPRETIEQLFLVAPLHDIGKIGIPDSILLKPDRLTHGERQIMQQHCRIGERILQEPSVMELCSFAGEDERASAHQVDPLLRAARDIAAAHHERWDGEGYPNRLQGTQIPLPARIVAVADVYDALTSKRPYKPAMSAEQSVDIIKSGRGTQFDPGVVDAFLSVHDRMRTIRESVSAEVRRIMSTIAFSWLPETVDPQLAEPASGMADLTDVLFDGDAALGHSPSQLVGSLWLPLERNVCIQQAVSNDGVIA